MGNALVCAVPICRPVQAVQIGALPCGFHASSATGGAWSPPHEQERPGYHDERSLRRGAEAAGRAAHRHRRRGGKGRLRTFRNFILIKRRAFALLFIMGIFRAPARPTFVNSDKSRQKHRKEPPVPSPPGALWYCAGLWAFTTRSQGIFFFCKKSFALPSATYFCQQ